MPAPAAPPAPASPIHELAPAMPAAPPLPAAPRDPGSSSAPPQAMRPHIINAAPPTRHANPRLAPRTARRQIPAPPSPFSLIDGDHCSQRASADDSAAILPAMARWGKWSAVVCLAIAFVVLGLSVRRAHACGGFFVPQAERKPSLAHEQVLIIHDPKTDTEHFIREVAFREANKRFGFVVPTPSRPKVAKVEKSPFKSLRLLFPFRRTKGIAPGGGIGSGSGYGRGAGKPAGVTVLEVSKVGSFTAFVLAATDAKALSKWLKDNGLVSSPEADRWLEHYVKMKFFYVAMRYDPPKGTASKSSVVNAETIRISFSTPIPYYPYFEPEHPEGVTGPRLMELWLAAPAKVQPVALRDNAGKREWFRPLKAGDAQSDARSRLVGSLSGGDAKLVPEGELVVQTFQDQKLERKGMGDILFPPMERRTLSDDDKKALAPLLGVLDPELVQ